MSESLIKSTSMSSSSSVIATSSSSKKPNNIPPRPPASVTTTSNNNNNLAAPTAIAAPLLTNTNSHNKNLYDVDDDDIEGDSHLPNDYDESELDSDIRHLKSSEIDYADPLDTRNHSTTILTPMSLSIAEAVKARRGRKRARYNDIDREYLLAIFDPNLNSDMDNADTLLRVMDRDDRRDVQETGRDYAVQEDSDEDVEYVPSLSDEIESDDDDVKDSDTGGSTSPSSDGNEKKE